MLLLVCTLVRLVQQNLVANQSRFGQSDKVDLANNLSKQKNQGWHYNGPNVVLFCTFQFGFLSSNKSDKRRPNFKFNFCTFVLFVLFMFFPLYFANMHFVQNLLRRSIQTSIHNLECVAQKMAELHLDTPETPPFDAHDKKKSHNLLRQFIRSSI